MKMENQMTLEQTARQEGNRLGLDYQILLDNNTLALEHMDSQEWWDMETPEQLKYVRMYLDYICIYNVTDVWFWYDSIHDRFRITVELRSSDGKTGSSFYYWTSKYHLASSLTDMQKYIVKS